MKNAALFPVSTETLPIARYINKYSTEYKITTLLAFPGSGLCGKDAGYADNREITGFVVSENFNETKDKWDVIFIAEQSDPNDEAHIRELTVEAIKNVLELNKQVICSARLLTDELNLIKEISRSKSIPFTYLPGAEMSFIKKSTGSIYVPSSYVAFVGGLIREVNSFEVFLSLMGKLQKKYDVLAFSTSANCELIGVKRLNILYSKEYSEIEKIYAINDFVKIISEKKPPDIIIVHISEPMMEYNNKVSNGFGILPYMISKALIPDYFICGVPSGNGNSAYINGVNEGICSRLGYAIDYVHLSNATYDFSQMLEEKETSVIYTSYVDVEDQIDQYYADSDIKVKNLMTDNGLGDLYKSLVNEVIDYNKVTSIVN